MDILIPSIVGCLQNMTSIHNSWDVTRKKTQHVGENGKAHTWSFGHRWQSQGRVNSLPLRKLADEAGQSGKQDHFNTTKSPVNLMCFSDLSFGLSRFDMWLNARLSDQVSACSWFQVGQEQTGPM